MEVFDASANAVYIFFRTKGSSVVPYANIAYGASAAYLGVDNGGGTVVVTTDSSGVIEHSTLGRTITGINYAVQAFQVIS